MSSTKAEVNIELEAIHPFPFHRSRHTLPSRQLSLSSIDLLMLIEAQPSKAQTLRATVALLQHSNEHRLLPVPTVWQCLDADVLRHECTAASARDKMLKTMQNHSI
jgi:hypothetical protein